MPGPGNGEIVVRYQAAFIVELVTSERIHRVSKIPGDLGTDIWR